MEMPFAWVGGHDVRLSLLVERPLQRCRLWMKAPSKAPELAAAIAQLQLAE